MSNVNITLNTEKKSRFKTKTQLFLHISSCWFNHLHRPLWRKPGASSTYKDQPYSSKNTSVLQLDEIIRNKAHESMTISVIYTPACLFTLHVSDLSLALICKIIYHVYFKYMIRKTHRLFIKNTLRLKRHVVNHLRLMFDLKSLKKTKTLWCANTHGKAKWV